MTEVTYYQAGTEGIQPDPDLLEGTDTGSGDPIGALGEEGVPEDSTDTPELIPTNVGSQVEDERSRFSSAIWFNKVQSKSIILAGCGGIGSYVGFLLGRLGPDTLLMYDPDIVEAVNMSGQLYFNNHIGQSKVAVLRRLIANSGVFAAVSVSSSRYTEESPTLPIMICGFDNMEARKVFYHNWKAAVERTPTDEKGKYLFIDGRLAAEEFQVFAIQGWDTQSMSRYEKEWLFSDEEAEATLCSYKQTSYMANMIGSVMVNIFVNFCANECNPVLPYEIPFMTTYRGDYMDFKVIR